jgi:hypothetical protein
MLTYVLAAMLLVGDPDDVVKIDPSLYYICADELRDLSVSLQIIDVQERRYTLVLPSDFHEDLAKLRKRNNELHDAPSAEDALRFPSREVVNKLLEFNREYRQHLVNVRDAFPYRYWEYVFVIEETERLYRIWDLVRDAGCEYYYITVRRQALKELRDLIGYDDYYRSKLPPWVPTWRFQAIN